MPFSVAVAGASGYAGGELLRLIQAHPDLELVTVTGHSSAGRRLRAVQPHLASLPDLELAETTPETLRGHDAVFLALPHGASGAITAGLDGEALVVDCGADHRLVDEADWTRFYGGDHAEPWTYGMPELPLAGGRSQRDELRAARRIAVPGCNATAVTLGLAPGIRAGVVSAADLVAVLAVGTSGAGRTLRPDLLFSEQHGSAAAYAVGGTHRHVPEIRQNLAAAGGVGTTLSFTPVLVPTSRGILATSTARLEPGVSAGDVRAAWGSAYDGEPFVRLLPEGAYPRTADTVGANTALVGVGVDDDASRVVTVVALDNLVKGTAGAALQSANLALGLPETTGLPVDGLGR